MPILTPTQRARERVQVWILCDEGGDLVFVHQREMSGGEPPPSGLLSDCTIGTVENLAKPHEEREDVIFIESHAAHRPNSSQVKAEHKQVSTAISSTIDGSSLYMGRPSFLASWKKCRSC